MHSVPVRQLDLRNTLEPRSLSKDEEKGAVRADGVCEQDTSSKRKQ